MPDVEDLLQFCPVGNVALNKLGAGWDQIASGVAEIVVNYDLVARVSSAFATVPPI